MTGALEALRLAVQKNTDAGNSVVALLKGLSAELKLHAGEKEEVLRIAGLMDTQSQVYADAALENTPAQPV